MLGDRRYAHLDVTAGRAPSPGFNSVSSINRSFRRRFPRDALGVCQTARLSVALIGLLRRALLTCSAVTADALLPKVLRM